MPDNPLASLGDLSKPASTLIEKIADAVGGIARPYQIVRVAKAEAKASRIRAEGEIEVKNLQRRALRRFAAEEAKKQANMEQIIRDAIPLLEDKSAPESVADDWITNFFEKCRIISDEEMQLLWSRILAGEANSPGSYARKTVNLLSDLDKDDALLFTRLCGFIWDFIEPETGSRSSIPLILKPIGDVYTSRAINFETLSHLETLGLIQFDGLIGFIRTQLPASLHLSYFGRTVHLTIPQPPHNTMSVGTVLFTRAGEELARACGSSPVEGFFEYVSGAWERASYLAGIAKPAQESPAQTQVELPEVPPVNPAS